MKKQIALLTVVFYLLAGPGSALAEYVCGQDLDGDGFADSAGETASCSPATDWSGSAPQWFCPVQSTPCQRPMSDPVVGQTCPQGYSYVSERDRCEASPVCAAGTYNPVTNQCDGGGSSHPAAVFVSTCSAQAQNTNINGSCTTAPGDKCLLGTWRWWVILFSYHAYFDQACTLTGVELTLNYTPYSWAPLNLAPGASSTLVSDGLTGTYTNSSTPTYYCPPGEILSGATCLASSAPGCVGGQLDPSLDVCFASSTATPVCAEGTYDPGSGKCIEDTYTCPLGGYACLDTGAAVPQCSPNPCFDLEVPGNEVTELPPEDPMLQNDGAVDEEGNCLGELYIFSGKASRCRPPGLTVGTVNDCCDSDEPALTDSTTGPRINQVVTAVQTVYEVAQVGYYAYSISTGAMAAVEVGGQVVVYNMASGTIAASYASGSAVGAGVMGAQGAVAAGGATASGTVGAGLTSYMGALFNPTTIAIAIVVAVVMKVLMGSGCDQRDIETALLGDSGYCHYVGTTCERKWPMVGCVQKARRYCCFNSKIARIIQEQGRPQLASFGPTGDWGTPKAPNCRGFTAEEFQMLDFARIDLSSYYGDIQKDLTQKVQDAQIDVQEKIEQHYEAIR